MKWGPFKAYEIHSNKKSKNHAISYEKNCYEIKNVHT